MQRGKLRKTRALRYARSRVAGHPELAEVARLARVFRAGPGVVRGIGEDCAWVRGGGRDWLLKTDPVVAGVHFPPEAPPVLIGRKAMNRNLSDVAACGGTPRFALVSALFPPRTPRSVRDGIYRGLQSAAAAAGVSVVGGDLGLTPGPLTLTVAVVGEPHPHGMPGRGGARPGDLLFVTGALGGSRLGKHLRFAPRLKWGARLCQRHRPSAMMDVSDGLLLDLYRMLCASGGRGARLHARAIPVSAAARQLARADGREPLDHALRDGEDYELLFAVPPRRARALMRDRALPPCARRPLGVVTASAGLWLLRPDRPDEELTVSGYEHRFA
jgi:thiamine-monophosphate kinase